MRAFVALELPPALQADLHALQMTFAAALDDPRLGRAVRWTAPANLHLTLRFLGETTAAQHAHVVGGMKNAAAQESPFAITLGGIGCFPTCRRPAILWLGIREDTGRLAALQGAVEEIAVAAGFAPEGRAFAPHLTLARIARGTASADVTCIGEAIAHVSHAPHVQTWGRRVPVAHVVFMQSDLQPQGAVYTALDRIALG